MDDVDRGKEDDESSASCCEKKDEADDVVTQKLPAVATGVDSDGLGKESGIAVDDRKPPAAVPPPPPAAAATPGSARAGRYARKMQQIQERSRGRQNRGTSIASSLPEQQHQQQQTETENENEDMGILGASASSTQAGDTLAATIFASPPSSELSPTLGTSSTVSGNGASNSYVSRVARKMASQDNNSAELGVAAGLKAQRNAELAHSTAEHNETSTCGRRSLQEKDRQEKDIDGEVISPGAYSVPGRAIGDFPAWGRHRTAAATTPTASYSSTWDSQFCLDPQEASSPVQDGEIENDEIVAELVDQEELIKAYKQRLSLESTLAEVVETDENPNRNLARWVICIAVTFMLVGVFIGVFVGYTSTKGKNANSSGEPSTPSLSPSLPPTLEKIRNQNFLTCGVRNRSKAGFMDITNRTAPGLAKGFDIDLCHAVAAALFGENNVGDRVHLNFRGDGGMSRELQRFALNKSVDLVVSSVTANMQRDVNVGNGTGRGVSFSTPYLYDGIKFAGEKEFVECAEKFSFLDEGCYHLKICVCLGCTHRAFLSENYFPSSRLFPTDDEYTSLSEGKCNVISGEKLDVSSEALELHNVTYEGYYVGNKTVSTEPLAIVTKDDDVQWSNFVNWVLQSLLSAEKQNITQATAEKFKTTDVFGDEYKNMFIHAIKEVGNYGEIYSRHFESRMPRGGLDKINQDGTTGLIFSFPLGETTMWQPYPADKLEGKSTLEKVLKSGNLRCGISVRPGFGEYNNATNKWTGMDADYCKALSASLFDESQKDNITFVEYDSSDGEGFVLLANGTVDVLAGAPLTLEANVNESKTGEGFAFSQAYFYNGNDNAAGMVSPIGLATREGDRLWSSFVYWIVASTFYAEEQFITNASYYYMPSVELFGSDYSDMFRNAIQEVGNYGEIYARNIEVIRDNTRNALNSNGPQHFPLL